MIFHLIRHGKSHANEAGLVTGTPADTLTPMGLSQVMRTAEWIEKAGLVAQRHVTSHWARAHHTASNLVPYAAWRVDSRVGETIAGEAADWALSRFVTEVPRFYKDPSNRYPGGESHRDLNDRVLDWFRFQLTDPCEALMLVSHSGPISCILQHVLGLPMEKFPAFLPAHASLSVIEMACKKGEWSGRLIGFSICPVENMPQTFLGKMR